MLTLSKTTARCVAIILVALMWRSVASADTIYWSDGGSIHAFDVASGQSSTLISATGYGSQGNQINQPLSLTVGPDGSLYVGNGDSGTIVKVTPQGTASTFFSNPYGDTSGLVFDSHGILYDAQLGTGEIDQLTPDGKISLFVSGLDHPQAGTFDPEGNLYVLTGETLSGANVVRITPAGAMSTFATGVTGLVWDAQGDLYEGNGTGALTITTPSGSTSTIASGLTFPIPLGVDARGDVYVWQSSSKEELDLISGSGDVTPLQSIPHGLIATIAVPEPGITLACAAILTALPWRRRRSKPSTV